MTTLAPWVTRDDVMSGRVELPPLTMDAARGTQWDPANRPRQPVQLQPGQWNLGNDVVTPGHPRYGQMTNRTPQRAMAAGNVGNDVIFPGDPRFDDIMNRPRPTGGGGNVGNDVIFPGDPRYDEIMNRNRPAPAGGVRQGPMTHFGPQIDTNQIQVPTELPPDAPPGMSLHTFQRRYLEAVHKAAHGDASSVDLNDRWHPTIEGDVPMISREEADQRSSDQYYGHRPWLNPDAGTGGAAANLQQPPVAPTLTSQQASNDSPQTNALQANFTFVPPGGQTTAPTPTPTPTPTGTTGSATGVTNTPPTTGSTNTGGAGNTTSPGFVVTTNGGSGSSYDRAFESLFDEFSRAQDAGREANEERYQEILGGYADRENAIIAGVDLENQQLQEGFGGAQSAIANLYSSYLGPLMEMTQRWGQDQSRVAARENQARRTAGQQDMINRGLYNTTAAVGELQASDRDYGRRLNDIATAAATQRAGVQADASGAYTNSMAQLISARNEAMESAFQRGINQLVGGGIDTLNFMERRTDEYPDLNQLVELAVLAGEGQLSSGQQRNAGQETSPMTWNDYVRQTQWYKNQQRGVAPGLYARPSRDGYENYLRAWHSNNPGAASTSSRSFL